MIIIGHWQLERVRAWYSADGRLRITEDDGECYARPLLAADVLAMKTAGLNPNEPIASSLHMALEIAAAVTGASDRLVYGSPEYRILKTPLSVQRDFTSHDGGQWRLIIRGNYMMAGYGRWSSVYTQAQPHHTWYPSRKAALGALSAIVDPDSVYGDTVSKTADMAPAETE